MALVEKAKHIHFVGIGGIGLSALARVLLARGLRVSGSDAAENALTADLSQHGAQVYSGHHSANVNHADLLVITSAVNDSNPEVQEARARGIPILKRREFLKEFSAGFRTIAIAGSHGKTTTTALVGLMLESAGLDPTIVVGGVVPELGSNARAGQGEYLVIEGDEYDYAFLGLEPYIAVLTNVDYDHPDLFETHEAYQATFNDFVRRVRADGQLVVCGDDPVATSVARQAGHEVVYYGRGAENEWRASAIAVNANGGSDFDVWHDGQSLGRVQTRIAGEHNVLNVLGALAVGHSVGADWNAILEMVQRFGGVGRRFEIRGEFKGSVIVDDYAHHPTEIRATLAAARARFPGRELWAVFQPHTFSRTRALLEDFANAFQDADHVIITEVYASRERESFGVSGRDIVARMSHGDVKFISTLREVLDFLTDRLDQNTVLVTLGAGNVNQVARDLVDLGDA